MRKIKSIKNIQRDKRGWIIFPITDEDIANESVKNIHLASINPSEIRGNHYHLIKTENIIIFGGKVLIAIQDLNTNEDITSQEIDCEDPIILEIEPQVAHAIKNISESVVNLFCYGSAAYDEKNPDIVRKVILF